MRVAQVGIVRPRGKIDPEQLLADWPTLPAVAVPVGDHRALAAAIARLANDETARMALARGAQTAALRQDANVTTAEFRRPYTALRGQATVATVDGATSTISR